MPTWVIAVWRKRPGLIWGGAAEAIRALRKQVADLRIEIEKMRAPRA